MTKDQQAQALGYKDFETLCRAIGVAEAEAKMQPAKRRPGRPKGFAQELKKK